VDTSDKDRLMEALLQERDEMYQELSRLRESDNGSLEWAEKKNERYEVVIRKKDDKIKQLTDQLAWYRRKFWKSSSERFIPEDPNQRRIDFDGLDVLPQEKEVIEEAEKEIISYERKKTATAKRTGASRRRSDSGKYKNCYSSFAAITTQ
jgi:transposase